MSFRVEPTTYIKYSVIKFIIVLLYRNVVKKIEKLIVTIYLAKKHLLIKQIVLLTV